MLCAGERELCLEPTNEGSVTGNITGPLQLHEVENKGKKLVAIYCFSFLPELYPENGGSKFFPNVDAYLQSYAVSHCGRCLRTELHRVRLQSVPTY